MIGFNGDQLLNFELFIIHIDTENKGKEVVPPLEHDKGKDMVPSSQVMLVQVPLVDNDMLEEPPSGKHRNYDHYHEEGWPTHFCKGWATFFVVHQIKFSYMATFKLLTPDTLEVIVFSEDGIEVVTKCGRYDDAFIVNV
ncbi:u-box domain-containing protein 4 [Hordeum vulgare]|nr:u-box domain-containing protein 4 [Hordeum vulgare]